MPRVLVIDDDKAMTTQLTSLLGEIDGFQIEIEVANDRQTAEAMIEQGAFDLALVDIDLGTSREDKYAGLGLLGRLNAKHCTTLVVSGTNEENLRGVTVSGLRAYDFISKPINDLVVINTVKHALQFFDPNRKAEDVSGWPAGLTEDPDNHTLVRWWNKKISLTLHELIIVRTLATSAGQTVNYRRLYDPLPSGRSKEALSVHVSNIRRKFRDIDDGFDRIINQVGQGYCWRTES